ncbi:DUF262 domain-containing protein [Peribacillus frigoritolerans]|uniref:GmrSD restriction endonuclease domain-containing protein n=1 Tax=Peribacillus frigoritolerans TaxID=450367 RepID=UPI0037F39B9E
MNNNPMSITNVNLDHHIPSESLLAMGDYQRIPKSDEAQLHKKDYLEYRDFLRDDSGLTIWDRLRKPEFQRQTNFWNDQKCNNLLKTLRNNQVIPGVIFWLNTSTGHIFVLDGAHRLSVIRAWFTDDWGDTSEAQEYGYLEEDELHAAKRLRDTIDEEIGSYKDCTEAGKKFRKIVNNRENPSEFLDKEAESKGRFSYNLSTALRIPIQWVTGDYEDAENSFININTGGTPLSDEEVNYLANRRSPVARAMTGIISNGSKEFLWLGHEERCQTLSQQLYDILLAPSDKISEKIKVTEYPLCLLKKKNSFDRYQFLQGLFTISKYGQTGADKIRNTISEFANEIDNDKVADITLKHLEDVNSLLSHIRSKRSQSIGLLPAFYFYSTKGHFRQTLFFVFLMWFSRGSDSEIKKRKQAFTLVRGEFEEIWMIIKDYVFKGLGRKGAGPYRLTKKHLDTLDKLLEEIIQGIEAKKESYEIAESYLKIFDNKVYTDFKLDNKGISGKSFKSFSKGTKTQKELLSFFQGTYKCEICNGAIEIGVSQQVDHKIKRSQGGTNGSINARLVHPWCNNNRETIELLVSKNESLHNDMNNISIPLDKPAPDLTINKEEQQQLSLDLFN